MNFAQFRQLISEEKLNEKKHDQIIKMLNLA